MISVERFSGIAIRKGRRADGSALTALVRNALIEYDLPPDPQGTDADLLDVETAYFSRGGYFEVLLDEERIVGCYGLYPLDDTTVELRKMYFIPELRGKGWGRASLRRALEKSVALGFTAMRLETASQLKEAIALYRNFGFRQLPACPDVPRCDQVFELSLQDWAYSGRETRQFEAAD